jgi:hypothetical protein
MTIKYPDISVKLTGCNGNAFAVMGKVGRALRLAKVSSVEIAAFYEDARSGDYNNMLMTCISWVDVS